MVIVAVIARHYSSRSVSRGGSQKTFISRTVTGNCSCVFIAVRSFTSKKRHNSIWKVPGPTVLCHSYCLLYTNMCIPLAICMLYLSSFSPLPPTLTKPSNIYWLRNTNVCLLTPNARRMPCSIPCYWYVHVQFQQYNFFILVELSKYNMKRIMGLEKT